MIKYGIQRRGTAGFKEPFKENFFENIDSEEKAYFLGFLMADGNVYVRKQSQPCIRLEISVKDLEILERFKMAIESKNSICFDKRNCCSLKVHSSKKDAESLREYMYNDATIYLKRKYDSCYKIYVNTERDWITIPCNA